MKILYANQLRITNQNKESDCFKFSPKTIEGLSY